MSDHPAPDWSAAIARLRQQLDQIELRHQQAMKELRNELEALEGRLPHELPPPLPPVPAPKAVAPEQASWEIDPVASRDIPAASASEVKHSVWPSSPAPAVETQLKGEQLAEVVAKAADGSFELNFGRVWLVRIGVVLLITGLVYGANLVYKSFIHDLPAGFRLAGIYLCALLISGTGAWLAKKDLYKRYGEVLVAGGLALFYYCTYAAHQVPRLRVIESPVTAAVLLLGAAGIIAAVSWIRQSRATAVMGLLLASYATVIQPLDWLSAGSNLILSVTGILLMLRPGWGAPGLASLLGTYGAFAGWQVLGAAGPGHGDPRATLWFLPGSWAIFAVPGIMGRFRTSLGERGRTWFAGANNALFFLLFLWVWRTCYGTAYFWEVSAIFGAILIGLGAVGRRRNDVVAGVNLIQGLGFLTFAIILKFTLYRLGVALAIESLVLAIGFHKFRKPAEFCFSLLAGMGAAIVLVHLRFHRIAGIPWAEAWKLAPPWSGAVAAALVAGAAVIFRRTVERAVTPGPAEVRKAASLLAYSALAILIFGWCLRLPEVWRLPVAAALAAGFAATSWWLDRRRWMPELAWGSAALGVLLFPLLGSPGEPRAQVLALLAGLAACVIWHQPREVKIPESGASPDPFRKPGPAAWLFAVFVPLTYAWLLESTVFSHSMIVWLAGGAVALVAIARATKAIRLETTTLFLNVGALGSLVKSLILGYSDMPGTLSFAPAAAALAILAIITWGRAELPHPQTAITRATLFFAWSAALMFAIPRGFIDLMAASAGAAFVLARLRNRIAPLNAWGWTLLSLLALIKTQIEGAGSAFHGYFFEGIVLMTLLAGIAMWPPRMPGTESQRAAEKGLPWFACLAFSIWSTHLTVERFGWTAAAVLWTALGFALVSLGLVLNRAVPRKAGFVLLALALAKLFCLDVWHFSTGMQVVSFIALGLALLLLGMFYHRFVPKLKRMLDEDPPPPAAPDSKTTE